MSSDADRTIVYRSVVHKRQAEAAVESMAEEMRTHRRISEILGLSGRTYAEQIIDLGDDSYVVAVANAIGKEGRTLYAVIVSGERVHALYETKDLALLSYVARDYRGMEQSALIYGAARMLADQARSER